METLMVLLFLFVAVILYVVGVLTGREIFGCSGRPNREMPPLGVWKGRFVDKRIDSRDNAFYTFMVQTKKARSYYEVCEEAVVDPSEVTGLITAPEIEITVFQDWKDGFRKKIKAQSP